MILFYDSFKGKKKQHILGTIFGYGRRKYNTESFIKNSENSLFFNVCVGGEGGEWWEDPNFVLTRKNFFTVFIYLLDFINFQKVIYSATTCIISVFYARRTGSPFSSQCAVMHYIILLFRAELQILCVEKKRGYSMKICNFFSIKFR